MKIAIDLSQIIYDTGVSHYRENLVKNLLKIDTQNEYVLYGGSLRRLQDLRFRINDLGITTKTTVKTFPIPPRLADIVWNKLHVLPIEKLIGEVDLIHTSDWAEPPTKIKKLTTIHDLVALKFARVTPKIIIDTHKNRLKWVNKESARIIVPSMATKNDLIELGFGEERIRVIYEAPNHIKASDAEVLRVKDKYKIREDYIISIGVNPRKNISKSIEAFNLAKSGKDIKYIIVGQKVDSNHDDQRGVRFLSHVPEEDMADLLLWMT